MSIRLEHVSHVYSPDTPYAFTALHDIDLTLEDGEFIGLLGHTGSGKTTLVQHLNGLIRPTSGRVLVDGTDTAQKSASLLEVRRKVGLVFQYPEYQLFEETVQKDIAFGPKNLGLSEGEISDRVHRAMALVGLSEEFADRSPFELSGGQTRRVAIAGVLAMEPRFLILDEPAAGLDPMGQRSILQMISDLHRSGITVMMVSHSMDDIAPLATRLIVMNRGEIVLDGTPREVFRHPQLLTEIGLGVPQAAELANALRDAGYPLPEGLYLSDEVFEAIRALPRKGGVSC